MSVAISAQVIFALQPILQVSGGPALASHLVPSPMKPGKFARSIKARKKTRQRKKKKNQIYDADCIHLIQSATIPPPVPQGEPESLSPPEPIQLEEFTQYGQVTWLPPIRSEDEAARLAEPWFPPDYGSLFDGEEDFNY